MRASIGEGQSSGRIEDKMKHTLLLSKLLAYYALHQGHGFIFRREDVPGLSVGDTLQLNGIVPSKVKGKDKKYPLLKVETKWTVIGIETRENLRPVDEHISVLVEPLH